MLRTDNKHRIFSASVGVDVAVTVLPLFLSTAELVQHILRTDLGVALEHGPGLMTGQD